MKKRNHSLLDNPILSSFLMPVLFVVMLNLMSTFTALLFENAFGKTSLLYMINDDIARFCVSVLFIIFINQFFKKNCHFGITSGNFKKGMLLSLPGLIIVFWNLLQIIVNHLPLVSGTNAVIAAIIAGIGPGVAEEMISRGFVISNLMRLWKDKDKKYLYILFISGFSFGLLHAVNYFVTYDLLGTFAQVIYASAIGIFYAAVYLRSRNLWGVMIVHSLTDIVAMMIVYEMGNTTILDVIFALVLSIIMIGIALLIIRPGTYQEMDEIWKDNWELSTEITKKPLWKTIRIFLFVLFILFASSVGVVLYKSYMGYQTEAPQITDVECEINPEKTQIKIQMPKEMGSMITLNNSDPEVLIQTTVTVEEKKTSYTFKVGNVQEEKKVTLNFKSVILDNQTELTMGTYTIVISIDKNGKITDYHDVN